MFLLLSTFFLQLQAIDKKFSLSVGCFMKHGKLKQTCSAVLSKKIEIKVTLFESVLPNDLGFLLKLPFSTIHDSSILTGHPYSAEELKAINKLLDKVRCIAFKPSTDGAVTLFPSDKMQPFLVDVLEKNIKYFGQKKLFMFLGPVLYNKRGILLEGDARWTNTIDRINVSREAFVEAFALCNERKFPQLNLLVVGTSGLESQDVERKIWSTIGNKDDFEKDILERLGQQGQDEKHSALMGGVGLSAGYHYHTKNFIFNLRTGVDHIWGKFRQTGPQNADTENMPKLGWGITLGTGIDYKFTEKSTIGLEGGVRFSEFKIPQKDKPTETKSSWFMAPYAQVVCGFYPTPDYSVSVFTGYFFPRTFAVKTEGTRITEGTKCKVDGLFGGLRFARYF